MLLEVNHESQFYQSLLDELRSGKKMTVTQTQYDELIKRFGSEKIPTNVTITPTPEAAVSPDEKAGGNS